MLTWLVVVYDWRIVHLIRLTLRIGAMWRGVGMED